MNKVIFSLLLYCFSLYAIELNITTSKDINASKEEIKATIDQYMQNHVKIEYQDAKKVVEDNRIMSDIYIKKNPLDDYAKSTILLRIEEFFAGKFIANLQQKESLSDDILKSYYIENTEEFKEPAYLKMKFFTSNNYETIYKLYSKIKENKSIPNRKFLKENNISARDVNASITQLRRDIVDMLPSKDMNGFFTTPEFFTDHYTLIYILESKEEKIKSYSMVKNDIKHKLLLKTFKRKRNEFIKKYKKDHD